MLDRARLKHAFLLLGQHLAERQVFVELAVYGGSAIMLQFAWRRGTEDVDAVVRDGFDESALAPSVRHVAEVMQLPPDWLNNAVGMFTPLQEDESLFEIAGAFPPGDRPGLRVLVARPHYLLAMKLRAFASLDRGDKDLADARLLAAELDLKTVGDLHRLYVSVHRADPSEPAARLFRSVVSGL